MEYERKKKRTKNQRNNIHTGIPNLRFYLLLSVIGFKENILSHLDYEYSKSACLMCTVFFLLIVALSHVLCINGICGTILMKCSLFSNGKLANSD